jgi:hypothetical protein
MSVPDNTVFYSSESFTKIWKIKNTGECTWTKSYALVFVDGEKLSETEIINLTSTVPPDLTIDLSVDMKAPAVPGKYQSNWQLQDESGNRFGMGTQADKPFWVRIEVREPLTTPTVEATSTSVPTITLSPEATILYDFSQNVCAAQWTVNNGMLSCPGERDAPQGFVIFTDQPLLDDGAIIQQPAILTAPYLAEDGFIEGVYPDYVVQPGDHFQSTVGCELNAIGCSVLYQVRYQDQAGAVHDLGVIGDFHDGSVYHFDIDLNPLAGQTIKLILRVSTLRTVGDDRAYWIAPRIIHTEIALPPSPTPDPTQPATPTLEPSPTSVPSPTPTATQTPAPPPAQPPKTVWEQIKDFFSALFRSLFGE